MLTFLGGYILPYTKVKKEILKRTKRTNGVRKTNGLVEQNSNLGQLPVPKRAFTRFHINFTTGYIYT